jgi:hypothetical protein
VIVHDSLLFIDKQEAAVEFLTEPQGASFAWLLDFNADLDEGDDLSDLS